MVAIISPFKAHALYTFSFKMLGDNERSIISYRKKIEDGLLNYLVDFDCFGNVHTVEYRFKVPVYEDNLTVLGNR
jgi:hypothetical protein